MSNQQNCILLGVPLDSGKRRRGCLMGPDAYRTAGLERALRDLGHSVTDRGNVAPAPFQAKEHEKLHALEETIAWTESLAAAADADFHTPQTSDSGNLHGTPLGYVTGREGFDGFPKIDTPLPHDNIAMIGLRSVDALERAALQETTVTYVDMREIDESGIAKPLQRFLDKVEAAGGMLHVSLDVDFLDPSVAPAVGTTVPGGATVREGHLVMEMVNDSGLLTSLDLVELNPYMDERGRTARLMVDLAASALGRNVFDRPTRAY